MEYLLNFLLPPMYFHRLDLQNLSQLALCFPTASLLHLLHYHSNNILETFRFLDILI